jgi:hypothetical protein
MFLAEFLVGLYFVFLSLSEFNRTALDLRIDGMLHG